MREFEDKDLVKLIKQGNHDAFKQLYERYHGQLFYVATRYLRDSDLVKDALQNVFLKVWNKRHGLDPNSSIKGLLFTMLKNHLLNKVRNDKTRKRILRQYKHSFNNQGSLTPLDDVLFEEYKEIFFEALNELTPSQREVVKMKMIEKLTNSKIASIRNVSVRTVKTQYYNGSKFIRSYLKKHAGIKNKKS